MAGGEVTEYCAAGKSSATPARRLTVPSFPKSPHGFPVFASRAIKRLSKVPNRIRWSSPFLLCQYETPRCWKNCCCPECPLCGSNCQISLPLSASSAITRLDGVEKYSTPSITKGVDSNGAT